MADYATLSELKHFVRADPDEDGDDLEMSLAITAASDAINKACNTTFPRPAVDAVERDIDNGIYGSPALPADADVPSGVRLACLLQASRWYKRRDAAFGVLGSPDMGNMTRLLAKLDPDVAVLISTYKRPWGAV